MPIHTTPQDAEAFVRAMRIVQGLHAQLPDSITPEVGSDLSGDEANTPRNVSPTRMAHSMMGAVADCLVAACHLFRPENAAGTRPIEVLLRTALIGACRTAFMLSPEDPEERRKNALTIAQVDARSGRKAWEVFGDFELVIKNAGETRDLMAKNADSILSLSSGAPMGEERMIGRMVDSVVWRLRDRTGENLLGEQLLLMWHGYSATAHTNFWQVTLTHQGSDGALPTTGSLIDNFVSLAMAAEFGVKILNQRFHS